MSLTLVAKNKISIEAPLSKVWEVLVAPKYIRQWDDLPQDFEDFYLDVGRTIVWPGSSRMTVTVCEPYQRLVFSLYAEKWEGPPADYDIAYRFSLSETDTGTALSLEIGDFAVLADGESYYESSVEFAADALDKIKSLAENHVN
jgi:uncharacterized protein YndB with AHSA1/START domain